MVRNAHFFVPKRCVYSEALPNYLGSSDASRESSLIKSYTPLSAGAVHCFGLGVKIHAEQRYPCFDLAEVG